MASAAKYTTLHETCFNYPCVDNHAHPLLTAANRDAVDFEGIIAEATGPALLEDSVHTLACFKATAQLAKLFNLGPDATWNDVKAKRAQLPYDELCELSLKPTNIQCILFDDGLGGVEEWCESYKWHDRFTKSASKRIVRVEVVAQDILKTLVDASSLSYSSGTDPAYIPTLLETFAAKLTASIQASADDPEVVGFKSVACYRTGLDVATSCTQEDIEAALASCLSRYATISKLRLDDKHLNDYVVRATLEIAGKCNKPVQFHTGLGDNDLTLTRSSPAHLQGVIKAFPNTPFVLLHSSYPYTRDAGYLCSVYRNVYVDFGEIFPFISGTGQRAVLRQVLELCPTNKIMWSTDGHWWPESYYLGTVQAREALYAVLAESVRDGDLTEQQAVGMVKNALFHNANRIYSLGLSPL
ncbi:hypothetical protein GLOTRDRAFT_121229 [Gloeophyllum trabeum ATCC 11539]|uniref:Amidohydrolase-related domain-containing protein n=1 Tax=Gloeophyllum trabeum (strain ATCC 11539 / FP-39264 / Madison 617) TaxID=670483 RepID=S7RMT2_GLOTA|nr:uncharacterized protein GLOTRDRAFT_121229 [Gloeophyllum trabeum ATCC 11539]EPQ55775.1 hypothetical protein GLOTRDRAFT_121229 [Gloeophyllum trabeum ATCC 11539]